MIRFVILHLLNAITPSNIPIKYLININLPIGSINKVNNKQDNISHINTLIILIFSLKKHSTASIIKVLTTIVEINTKSK